MLSTFLYADEMAELATHMSFLLLDGIRRRQKNRQTQRKKASPDRSKRTVFLMEELMETQMRGPPAYGGENDGLNNGERRDKSADRLRKRCFY